MLALTLGILGAAVLLAGFGYALWPVWRNANSWTRVILGLAVLGPMLGYGLIGEIGLPDAPLEARLNRPSDDLPFAANLSRLHRYTHQNPDDARAWAMLARARFAVGQYPQSEQAWRRALSLAPNPQAQAQAHSGLAENLIRQADGMVSQLAAQHLRAAHDTNADLFAPIYFLGLHAVQQGRTQVAQRFWQSLKARTEPESPYHVLAQKQLQALTAP